METAEITRIIGYGLLVIGGGSAVALFAKAVFGAEKIAVKGTKTLWGLFLVGLIVGLAILYLTD